MGSVGSSIKASTKLEPFQIENNKFNILWFRKDFRFAKFERKSTVRLKWFSSIDCFSKTFGLKHAITTTRSNYFPIYMPLWGFRINEFHRH
jgi:hypothetical protein